MVLWAFHRSQCHLELGRLEAVAMTVRGPAGDFLVPSGDSWVMELHPWKTLDDGVLVCRCDPEGDFLLM